jgi:putative ABC transport system permease protein
MLKNYFTIAWRNLLKNRTFSIINLTGLSFSVAFCLLLFIYIRHEQSFDRFHVKADRLFRMEMTNMWDKSKGGEEAAHSITWPLVVGPDMQKNFPEVKAVTRFQVNTNQMMKVGTTVYGGETLIYADANFFEMYSFPISGGNKMALHSFNDAVLSESTVRRYFGKANPIGRIISMANDSTRLFRVAAIAADAPDNSSLRFDIVLPLTADDGYAENMAGGFNHATHRMVIELADRVDAEAFSVKLNKWARTYFVEPFAAMVGKYQPDVDFSKLRFYIRPFTDAHYSTSAPWGHYTNKKNIYQLTCLVVVILLIASLNYVLLMISNAASRSQEVGVRKVMGAGRGAILLQSWAETQILVIISVMLGLLLGRLLFPIFTGLLGTSFSWADVKWGELSLALALLCAGLGLVAGYYPALVMSGIRPVTVLKGFRTFKINPRFSNGLVVLQFTACIVLMVAAMTINRQMSFINNKDLGFDKEQVLVVENEVFDETFVRNVRERLSTFSKTQPSILQFTNMMGSLDGKYNQNWFQLNGQSTFRNVITVNFGFFEMLGLKFVAGRPFSREMASDTMQSKRAIVVNETLFRMLGPSAKLEQYNEALRGTIIGVVKDYHFETLSKKIAPEEHRLGDRYATQFLFKIKGGRVPETIACIEKEYKAATGNYPFSYSFLDDTINKMYADDQRWQKIVATACFFALFIACMGLFGLSAIVAANRTKEIGIRKVLGAGVKDIFIQLSARFFALVVVAIVAATPLAAWMMNRWLENFAYRIQLQWWMFAGVGLMAVGIALVTVSFQVVKAAVVNPVESLRAE